MRILFICLGNICRSPTAEAILRLHAEDWYVDSAGTGGWHVGSAPYAPMQDVARSAGYEMGNLKARQISVEDFERFDLLIGMDAGNLADIESIRPEGSTTPLKCLADFVDDADHIPDPYYTRDFEFAFQLIERSVLALKTAVESDR